MTCAIRKNFNDTIIQLFLITYSYLDFSCRKKIYTRHHCLQFHDKTKAIKKTAVLIKICNVTELFKLYKHHSIDYCYAYEVYNQSLNTYFTKKCGISLFYIFPYKQTNLKEF